MEEFVAQEQSRHEQRVGFQKSSRIIRRKVSFKAKRNTEKEQKLLEEVHTEFSVNSTIGEMAYAFVKHGVSSATKISHMIRENYNVNKELSKGIYERPRVYPEVLRSLIKYSEQGKVFFDKESSNTRTVFLYYNREEKLAEQGLFEMQTTLF